MCGITGILRFDNELIKIQNLKNMTDSILHRGPDDEGQWVSKSKNIGLGHRRLSIIDLTNKAKQPMHYLNRYSIVYNGEIYNYLELKENLKSKKYIFSSTSDTEVLLALYAEKGKKMLQYLDGMFAFAIWDSLKKELFCARDRFGEKPFYYYLDKNKFVFASEMKAIWASGIKKELKQTRLDLFVKENFVHVKNDLSETFYDNIKSLEHSHYLLLKPSGELHYEKYWDINLENKFNGSFDEACENLNFLLKESVKKRLNADVPVGSSLSGGLDSSIIVSEIAKLLNNKSQFTYTAEFPGFEKNEAKYAKRVLSNLKKINGVSVYPNQNEFENKIKKLLYFQEEPFGSASVFVQWDVYRTASSNIKVILDGQGADEILGGYLPFYKDYLNQLFWWNKTLYKKELRAYNSLRNIKINSLKKDENIRMKLGRYKRKISRKDFSYKNNNLKHELYKSTMCGNLQDLLRYSDRNSMANSIEVRLPFLCHKLVEFCFTLPDKFLLNQGWTKFILRKSYTKALPNDIIWRKDKIGFEPPQNTWIEKKEIKKIIEYQKNKYKINNDQINIGSYTNSMDWKLFVSSYFH